jgi:hypothetical protein
LAFYSDSDWAGDVEKCISVTEFIINLLRVLICWRSKGRKEVTMSEALKEIGFIFYMLRDMGIPLKLPIMVRTDNVGAMFMARNSILVLELDTLILGIII